MFLTVLDSSSSQSCSVSTSVTRALELFSTKHLKNSTFYLLTLNRRASAVQSLTVINVYSGVYKLQLSA